MSKGDLILLGTSIQRSFAHEERITPIVSLVRPFHFADLAKG
jgi:hypothetical protein